MKLTPLYDPQEGQMRVAGLMSGSGSNLCKILEMERSMSDCPYHVVVIFSDNHKSNAVNIGKDYDVPVITRDLRSFYHARNKPRKDMQVREEFDRETLNALQPYGVKVAAYAGYMSIATPPLINAFLGVNVHPADLSIVENGRRKYTGDHAVRDAIVAGEKFLKSTTHIIENQVDYGRILMISDALPIAIEGDTNNKEQLEKIADEHQGNLKKIGDWVIFPKTLLYLAQGRYMQDGNGNLYFDNELISNGVKL